MPETITGPIRPLWLASYPRSGNTFLRIVLQNIFKLPTYSVYRVEGQQHRDPSAETLEQAPFLPQNWRRLLSSSSEAALTAIKTHDPPEDNGLAVYLVRDGRAAIHSYYHYHQKFAFEQPSLTEVIAGACQFGSWSAHYESWRPHDRPGTLVLRFEELVARPDAAIAQITKFLHRDPAQGRVPSFEELQAKFPEFFRRGQNQDYVKDWSSAQNALFNALHGATMKELGYSLVPSWESVPEIGCELARSAARLHQRYLQELHNQGVSLAAREELSARVSQLSDQASRLAAQLALGDRQLKSWWVRLGTRFGLVSPGQHKDGAKEAP